MRLIIFHYYEVDLWSERLRAAWWGLWDCVSALQDWSPSPVNYQPNYLKCTIDVPSSAPHASELVNCSQFPIAGASAQQRRKEHSIHSGLCGLWHVARSVSSQSHLGVGAQHMPHIRLTHRKGMRKVRNYCAPCRNIYDSNTSECFTT